MFSIRARTLRGLSSFFERSLGLSGSRCPIAHCPSPRGLRAALVGTVIDSRLLSHGDARGAPATPKEFRGLTTVSESPARARGPTSEWVGRRQMVGQMALRTRP